MPKVRFSWSVGEATPSSPPLPTAWRPLSLILPNLGYLMISDSKAVCKSLVRSSTACLRLCL
jgi:hypothetical protein